MADATALVDGLASELAARVSVLLPVELEAGEPTCEASEEGVTFDGSFAHATAPLRGDPSVCVHLVLHDVDALTVALLELGVEKDELEAKREAGFDADSVEALRKLARAALSALAVGIERELGHVLDTDAVALQVPTALEAPLAAGGWRLLCPLASEGVFDATLELLLPAEVAVAQPLLVVASSEEVRAAAEALTESLGTRVAGVAPEEFSLARLAALPRCPGVVFEWTAGDHLALDWLAALASDPRTKHVPAAVACAEPDRRQVRLALEAGARTFLHLPLEADELARRMGLGADPAASSGS